jgi:hypothetical protein
VSLPTFYQSTDASAPVLTGADGSLIALLDACLVNGYGAKVAAGWTKPFSSGINKGVYRAGGGNRFYLNVQDNGPGAGTFKEARAWGYEVATAQDTGTGQFPTAAQLAAGIIIRKSATADATARAWTLAADDRTFYLFVQTGDSGGTYLAFAFGDFFSLLTGDGFRTMIVGRATENSAVLTVDNLDLLLNPGASPATAMTGHYWPRAFTGLGGAAQFAKRGDANENGAAVNYVLHGLMPYPNPVDGGLYLSRVYMHETAGASGGALRGNMRGFWQFCHAASVVVDGDQFTGAPGSALAARTFQIVRASANGGVYCIETTAWDTSS